MPIYEYQCGKCQSIFEEWQSGFEDREMECPQCGESSKRLISHSSFHLKGGGWYADGYGGKNSGSQPTAASSSTDADKADKATSSGAGEAQSASTPSAQKSDSSSASSAS